MIYILEGPDGVGKTTLARAIQDKTKGHLLHASFNKDWDIEMYHLQLIDTALELDQYQDVIIDRWTPSEAVYGKVFRGSESYNTDRFLENISDRSNLVNPSVAKWIYCRNDKAVENHLKNKEERTEMFDDMTKIVEGFDKYMTKSKKLGYPWIEYDFDKVDMNSFVEEVCKSRK